jgi:hypothetical protein
MKNIYYLIHTTNYYNKDWTELQTSSIDNWQDQFPGAYLTLITKDNIDSERLFTGKYVLIFSYELLNQKNYHINIRDYNGLITEKNTYYPWNLNKAVEEIKNSTSTCRCNEVVFHDPISMKYLCKVIKRPSLLDLSDEEYEKHFSNPNSFLPKEPIKNIIKPDMSKEPFYCYPLEDDYSGIEPEPPGSDDFFKTMAKVCNIDKKIDKKKIIEEIKKKIPDLYSNRKEQNIQALKDFTRIGDRSRNENSRKQKRKGKMKTKKKSKMKTKKR